MADVKQHAPGSGTDRPSAGEPYITPMPRCRPDHFGTFSAWTARVMGGRWGFSVAVLVIVAWAVTGPIYRYSETWQLVVNTFTSVVTFLMVFLIQNSQNRESKAVHLKLDELIHSVRRADNQLINIEALNEEQLDMLAERYRKLGERYHREIESAAKVVDATEREEQKTRIVEFEPRDELSAPPRSPERVPANGRS